MRWQSTSSLTVSFSFGTLRVAELFPSRLVEALHPFALIMPLIPHYKLQDLVSGLDGVMYNDLMENIEWFFNLHDKNKDGYLTKDEVLTLSESFLVSLMDYSLSLIYSCLRACSSYFGSKLVTRTWVLSAAL